MRKLPIIITLFCICGCGNSASYQEPTLQVVDSTQVIDVSAGIFGGSVESLDGILESMEFIPLETSPNCIVAMVEALRMSENYIYILDSKSTVSIFDIEGHFVRQIGKGQGPEEISMARAIAFDRENRLLYVYDQAQSKMMKLKEDGTFVGVAYSDDNIIIEDFTIIDGHFVYVRPTSPFGKCEQYVSVADSSLNVVATVSLGKVNPRMGLHNYICETDSGCIISKPLSKEKFSRQNGIFYKKYIISDGGDDVPITGTSRGQKGIEETMEAIRAAGDFVYMGDYWETQNYQGFQFVPCAGKSGYRIAIRNKATGKVRGCEYAPNSIVNGFNPLFIAASNYRENVLITYFQPEYLQSQNPDIKWDGSNPNNIIPPEDMEKLRAVKPDDNPVIVLFKLKSDL